MDYFLYKKHLIKVSTIIVVCLAVFFSINYVIDPYNINQKFNICKNKKGECKRERVSKFFRLNEVKPNAIMLGASRTEFLNARDFAKYTNNAVYNLALSGATIHEQLILLKYSIKHFNIKNVIIGISFSGFTTTNGIDDYRETFPLGLYEKKMSTPLKIFFENYLSKSALKLSYETIMANKDEQFQFLDDTGSRTLDFQRFLISKDETTNRINKTLKDLEESISSTSVSLSNRKIQAFKRMIEICKKNNVVYNVFMTPIHFDYYNLICDYHLEKLYEWKKEIALITNYTDFSGKNDITTNDNNYIEGSHVKQQIGKLIFARIYNDNNVDVPINFGKSITFKNFEHLSYIPPAILGESNLLRNQAK